MDTKLIQIIVIFIFHISMGLLYPEDFGIITMLAIVAYTVNYNKCKD